MALGILVLITALSISAVAIYYSIAGLVAIFAAAAIPIVVMGTALEVGKLVTAVWLHKYWSRATWWLKTYLTTAVVVLMFITSMGIFGFLSKAHIEQTSASEESVAQVTQIDSEIGRLTAVIERAELKIEQLESSGTGSDANIQAQIDKEQERIDRAFDRIAPAIEQQNAIIRDAREGDANRTKPYEDQLANISQEIIRLENSARDYETQIQNLESDTGSVQPLLDQIASIQATITKVEGQLASGEREQIKQAQTTIGANADGSAGPRTRAAANAWIETQKVVINGLNDQVAQLRKDATQTVNAERDRLTAIVKDIRSNQIPALKERELVMLGKIDEVRQTESPVIQTARDEIQRLRKSAEEQVVNSQALIERLRGQLAQTDKADEIDALVDEQLARIKTAEGEVDTLTEEKYALEAEYRKLEAEVGPIKYIAEFVYGDTADNNMLEEAVRWVILIIIFVFDPLAVLLLIASQYTFEFARGRKDDRGERLRQEYEQLRAQKIANNPGFTVGAPAPEESKEEVDEQPSNTTQEDVESVGTGQEEESPEPEVEDTKPDPAPEEQQELKFLQEEVQEDLAGQKKTIESLDELAQERAKEIEYLDSLSHWNIAKERWKEANPHDNLKTHKKAYIRGFIDKLPWEAYLPQEVFEDEEFVETHIPKTEGYVQNAEQSDDSIWKRIKNDKPDNTT